MNGFVVITFFLFDNMFLKTRFYFKLFNYFYRQNEWLATRNWQFVSEKKLTLYLQYQVTFNSFIT